MLLIMTAVQDKAADTTPWLPIEELLYFVTFVSKLELSSSHLLRLRPASPFTPHPVKGPAPNLTHGTQETGSISPSSPLVL